MNTTQPWRMSFCELLDERAEMKAKEHELPTVVLGDKFVLQSDHPDVMAWTKRLEDVEAEINRRAPRYA